MQTERSSFNRGRALERGGPQRELALQPTNGHGRAHRRAVDLGWFSIGLGLTQLLSPGLLGRSIGVGDDPRTRATMRFLGLREIAAGVGLLSRKSDPVFMWARVAGDLMDLALLGKAFTSASSDRQRVVSATAAVVGCTVLDAFTAVQVSRAPAKGDAEQKVGGRSLRQAVHATHSITVARPLEEVRRAWDQSPVTAGLRDQGEVDIHVAPGNQGTEICLELKGSPPSMAREMIGNIFSTGPGRGVDADLRRFKQLVEIGEIVHSNASIHGHPHPGRPSAEDGRLVSR